MNLYNLINKEKFWSKVDIREEDKCWHWKDASNSKGYGTYWIDRLTQIQAHRVSWYITNGPIPEGELILHKCDNPICVNPNHLYCGSYLDNRRDRDLRNPVSANALAKGKGMFHEGEIWLIRRLKILTCDGTIKRYKFPATLVGKMFKTSNRTILNIWNSEVYFCKEGYYV